jgi:6-phosphofructokinase
MVAILIENNMQVYVIGGDGTHRGAAKLYEVGRTRRVLHAMVALEDGVVRSTAV